MSTSPYSADARSALPHGGRLRAAAERYGIALGEWLDVSTGINPNGWPVPALPAQTWARLPEEDDGLETAARDYYGTDAILPVAGSQAAIQALPQLHAPCHVGMIAPSYAEHAHAWQAAGHNVVPIAADRLDSFVPQIDILVLVHPNNPTGARYTRAQLLRWHELLHARGGWLVVDEAFIDTAPEQSLAPLCPLPGLIVLRSLGKFFGLAGARVGFVCAPREPLQRLASQLGPWTVATPSRWVAMQALKDHAWQNETRRQLDARSARLAALLTQHGLAPRGGCSLFQWIPTRRAWALHDALARRGILTRFFDQPLSLRIGLPKTECDWTRLDAALADVCAVAPIEAAV